MQAPFATETIWLKDWDITDVSGIRRAQFSVGPGEHGSRLTAYHVSSESPLPTAPVYRGRITGATEGTQVVSSFAGGNQNRLGGYFSGFADAASSSDVSIAQGDDGIRCLQVNCRRVEKGYCGVWIHTFDFTELPADRWYLDASRFKFLSFWIRGDEGVPVQLRVADAEWERREDTLPVGDVAEFLPAGRITGDWQQALVPVGRLPQRFDLSLMASFVFQATAVGSASFFLSELALLEGKDSFVPRPAPTEHVTLEGGLHKSTWVWNTAELLADPSTVQPLIDLLVREHFDTVYLQLPDGGSKSNQKGEILLDTESLRSLVGAFNAHGFRVFALDGYARFALSEYHAGVLATVEEVIDFNERVEEAERFFGIRYDIEPYLLPGFHGPARQSIVSGFLELVEAIAQRSHEAGLVFGVDIPFWYDARSEYTGEPVMAMFAGERKPVSHHVIDLVDEIAVMAYRTTAFGADGVVRHSADELDYATRVGKEAYVAVETHPLPDEELVDLNGLPTTGIPVAVEGRGALFAVASGDSVMFALADPGTDARLGLLKIMSEAGVNESAVFWWPVSRRVKVPGAKLSFATLGAKRLNEVMQQALPELRRQPSFAGFAVHHAGSLRDLLGHHSTMPGEGRGEAGTR